MYIEKDSDVNEEIEKMRMHAVSSIVSRSDTIIVASISCIYSLGNPEDFRMMAIDLEVGKQMTRQKLIHALVDMQYERNDMVLEPGRFRVRGDTLDIVPSYENDIIRVELNGNQIGKLKEVHTITGNVKTALTNLRFTPPVNTSCPKRNMHWRLSISSRNWKNVYPSCRHLRRSDLNSEQTTIWR